MLEKTDYFNLVQKLFSYLISEFDFDRVQEDSIGNIYYDIKYRDKNREISISYEVVENCLQVIVFLLQDGGMPNYDDKIQTLHLDKLNSLLFTKIDKKEILANDEFFSKNNPKTELERKLLKSAKELRLCLKHFKKLR